MDIGYVLAMKAKHKLSRLHLRLLYFLLPVVGVLSNLLPFVAAFIINKLMARRNGLYIHVNRILFSISGSSITLKNLTIDVKEPAAGGQSRIFKVLTITLSIEYKALLKGLLIFDIAIDKPEVIYIKGTQLPQVMSSTAPPDVQIICNQALISDGSIRYIDNTITPTLDFLAGNVNMVASGISNKPHPQKKLPAEIAVNAEICDGVLNAMIKADASAVQPTFDINAEIKHVNLVQLNSLFKAYGNFDVSQGTLSMFAEAAALESKFKGYVKAEIVNLDILGPEDRHDSMISRLWQGLLGATVQLFENQKKDQMGTKIPFSGTFTNPKIGFWMASAQVLINAFVKALQPGIDYEININSPKEDKAA